MSDEDCDCEEDNDATFLREDLRKSRQRQSCISCNNDIEVGELHVAQSALMDGSAYTVRLHMDCSLVSCGCSQRERPQSRPFKRMLRHNFMYPGYPPDYPPYPGFTMTYSK